MNVGINRGNFLIVMVMQSQMRFRKNQENGCGILTPQPQTTEDFNSARQLEQLKVGNYCTA